MARHICHQGPPNGISNIISSLLFQPLRPVSSSHGSSMHPPAGPPTSCSHRHGAPVASIINYAVPVTVAGKAFAPRLARCNGGQWTRPWGCAYGLCGLPHFFMQAAAPDRAAPCAACCCCLGHQSTRCAPVDLLQTRDPLTAPRLHRSTSSYSARTPTYVPLLSPAVLEYHRVDMFGRETTTCSYIRTSTSLLPTLGGHLPEWACGVGELWPEKRLPGAGRSQCS